MADELHAPNALSQIMGPLEPSRTKVVKIVRW